MSREKKRSLNSVHISSLNLDTIKIAFFPLFFFFCIIRLWLRKKKRKPSVLKVSNDHFVSILLLVILCLTDELHNYIDGPFRQQRLPAWQPVLIPRNVLPTLFIFGIIFCPIGGLLYWNSGRVSRNTKQAEGWLRLDTDGFTINVFR
jgi:hypothetical protein